MRSTLAIAVTAALSVAGLAAVPAAETALDNARHYVHCAGSAPVSNVDAVATAIPQFDDVEPTGAFPGGCAVVDSGMTGGTDHNPIYDTPFQGFVEGAIDSMTLHLYVANVGPMNGGVLPPEIGAHVVVDGAAHLVRDTNYPVAVSEGPFPGTQLWELTITDMAVPDDGEHFVQITLYQPYADGGEDIWLFDTTDTPTGLTFNPEEPAAVAIRSAA